MERVSNIEISFSEKMQADLASVVSKLCVFAGGLGLFLEANRETYDPVLTLISLASISYGIFLDALPKTAHLKAKEKIIDLNSHDVK